MNLSFEPIAPRLDWRAWLLALAFFATSFAVTVQNNRFPASYHPDEPTKARQVIREDFNFHHPMLLLSSVRALAKMSGAGDSVDRVTIAGRTMSALFTSAAIACLVLLAFLHGGAFAAFAAGTILTLNHQLLELAHYFKEDPSLLFGMSLFFLLMTVYLNAPSFLTAAAMGFGAGFATSGKYLGAVTLAIAVVAIFISRTGGGTRMPHFGVSILSATIVFVLFNLPVFSNLGSFEHGFTRELGFAMHGHKGLTRRVPHGVYGAVFREATNPVVWILLVIYYGSLIFRWRDTKPAERILAAFPILFALGLSFSPKTHHRYFLPATGLLCCLAALGCFWTTRLRLNGKFPLGSPHIAGAVLLAAAVLVQLPRFATTYTGFSRDARTELAGYVRQQVPANSTIVQDKRVNLRTFDLPITIRGDDFAADEGPLDELRAAGVRYIAVCEGDFGRFFLKTHKPTQSGAEDFVRRREFYEQLFQSGTVVWESKAGANQYLQPAIKLYRLD